jgi:hypothetical protein
MNVSQQFLLSYMESLLQIKYHPCKDLTKGKFMLDTEVMKFHSLKEQTTEPCLHWTAPQAGWYKLNTDWSFLGKEAGAGMICHDSEGAIIFSACRQIFRCKDAPGAELSALFEGVSLALQRCSLPLIIETDCLEIVKILENEEMDWSTYIYNRGDKNLAKGSSDL